MAWAERPLTDRECALTEGPRCNEIALRLKHIRKVVEGSRDIKMVLAKRLFAYRECPLVEGPRRDEVALVNK
jgi:hypothetical protein